MQLLNELLFLREQTIYKTPSGDIIKSVIITDDGTQYLLSDKNQSKRIKGDTGLKKWSQHCFFVPPKYKIEANAVIHLTDNKNHTIGESSTLYLTYNETTVAFWKLDENKKPIALTWGDAFPKGKPSPKKDTDQMYFMYTKKPTKGNIVVEFDEGQNNSIKNYYCGTPVTDIQDINDVSDDIISLFKGK